MLTSYNLKMPHAVYGGENAMDNITAILRTCGARRVALFTDKCQHRFFPRLFQIRQPQHHCKNSCGPVGLQRGPLPRSLQLCAGRGHRGAEKSSGGERRKRNALIGKGGAT